MLKVIESGKVNDLLKSLRERDAKSTSEINEKVNKIISNVKKSGDKALRKYTFDFDFVNLVNIEVSQQELSKAIMKVDKSFINAISEAAMNIEKYHEKQLHTGYEIKEKYDSYLGQRVMPLKRVGVYVPGGRAAYPSTVLMNVIPAKIAGVENIVMVTPPNKKGGIDPYIACAAKIAGVDHIYKVGGAQSIAALAYGTETIPRVDKIVGPGNIYVSCAKRMVYGVVDIDMIAGPSEILVVADKNADPRFVAADLLSQAEHDPMACSILLSTSEKLIKEVNNEISEQLKLLPKREIAEKSIVNYGRAIHLKTIEDCVMAANQIAPEHLELQVENPKKYLNMVENAGSVFLGYYTCESVGDYICGTNHVLPTNGSARFYSPLSVDSFIKKSSYTYYSKEKLNEVGSKIINIAEHEGLEAHANAVKVRIEDGKENN